MLPNFLVIGAAKCGTTSICDLLGHHPDVFMTNPKEPHFFGRDDPKKTMDWYKQFFIGSEGKHAVGEGSTSYTHPDIIQKAATAIFETIPKCQLIYMVRHPIKRLESDWKMRCHEGWATGSINESVEQQASLITHGMYWRNISVYLDIFPEDQIHIVFLEDFAKDPSAELGKCFAHINIDPSIKISGVEKPRNQSADFRQDTFLGAIVRNNKSIKSIKNAIPQWAKESAKRILTRKETLVVKWHPDVKQHAIEKLKDDAGQLLKYCRKPDEYWKFEI